MSFCGWSSGEKYKDHFDKGVYVCSKCGADLFYSEKKFQHSSPWPAFTETVRPDSVSKRPDGPSALKVSCAKCGNGLGHEFLNDGPKAGCERVGGKFKGRGQWKEITIELGLEDMRNMMF